MSPTADQRHRPNLTAKQTTPAFAAPRISSRRRALASSGGTAVPKSFAGIPALAQEEKKLPMAVFHGGLRLPLQCKLAIGAVNDPLEGEADAMADRVLRTPVPEVSLASADLSTTPVVQRRESGSAAAEAAEAPPIVHEVLSSPGQPLDFTSRAFFEPRIGYDFSTVRIHTGFRAARSAEAVNAVAYAVGEHIVFGDGHYSPQTSQGRQLLAHELAHTVQQRETSSHRIARQPLTPAPAAAPAKPKVKTGTFKDRWHYVAYLDQGLIRLARDVMSTDITKRIGTVPWITNNPGNLTVSTAASAGPAQKEPFKQGAYGKTAADADPETRRYAIFASREAGLAAIFPVLKVINESNGGKLTLKAVLKIYKGTDPSEDESVKTSYVAKIRQFMTEEILVEAPSLSQSEAQSQAEKILNTAFSSLSSADMPFEIARNALTREEGRLNPPGVEYTCANGFAANDKSRYTDEQWTAIENLKFFEKEIQGILECP
jgi:hypothetical protein